MVDRAEFTWRTSSKSSGGNCVEIAADGEQVHMRDSKDPAGPRLTFDRVAFQDFVAYIKESSPIDQ